TGGCEKPGRAGYQGHLSCRTTMGVTMKSGKTWRELATWVGTAVVAVAVGAGLAYAKLPQPPLDDAAKAKVEEAKAKAAVATKKAREDEEKAMDRVAERYKKGKSIKPVAAASATAAPKT